jgi:DNA-binding NarL/FixJ family response regulator
MLSRSRGATASTASPCRCRRRVLSVFIERATSGPGHIFPAGRGHFTDREKEVLELLVAGHPYREIGPPLGIEERTVKAHVAKMMRKAGVHNRVALSIHAITHSLVSGYAFESSRQQDSDPVARSISMEQAGQSGVRQS